MSGEYLSLEEPTKIVQKWRLGQWVEGHYSTLTIGFDQNDSDAVTVMRVQWDGVPVGQEEVTRRNWGEYYVRSIKTTFGYVDLEKSPAHLDYTETDPVQIWHCSLGNLRVNMIQHGSAPKIHSAIKAS